MKGKQPTINPDWTERLNTTERELLNMMELDWPGAIVFLRDALDTYARAHPTCEARKLAEAARGAIEGYREARAARASDRDRLRAFATTLATALDMNLEPVLPESLRILRSPERSAFADERSG